MYMKQNYAIYHIYKDSTKKLLQDEFRETF